MYLDDILLYTRSVEDMITNLETVLTRLEELGLKLKPSKCHLFKEGLYRIWCDANTLGDSGVNTLGDTSAFVYPVVQLLFTRRGKIRIDGVGIVFEFYIAPV